jgi:hypothetical protein
MTEKNELSVPEAARRDPNSLEILRVWIANNAQHVSLQTGIWDDPVAWGIMLADLARHVANSYYIDAGLDKNQSLERIKAGWAAEMDSPTDEPSGQMED